MFPPVAVTFIAVVVQVNTVVPVLLVIPAVGGGLTVKVTAFEVVGQVPIGS